MCQDLLGCTAPGHFLECRPRVLQIRQDKFLRHGLACGPCRGARAIQRLMRTLHQSDVTDVGNLGPVAKINC